MRRKILTGILTLGLFIAIANFSGAFAYFSDVEVSTGNKLQAGTWQSASLVVDTSRAFATGCSLDSLSSAFSCEGINDKLLESEISVKASPSHYGVHFLRLWNRGDENISIDKLKISWKDRGENLKRIFLCDWDFGTPWLWWPHGWDTEGGSKPPGSLIDIRNITLEPYESEGPLNPDNFIMGLGFDNNMEEKEISIDFIMEDSSSKEVTFTPPSFCDIWSDRDE